VILRTTLSAENNKKNDTNHFVKTQKKNRGATRKKQHNHRTPKQKRNQPTMSGAPTRFLSDPCDQRYREDISAFNGDRALYVPAVMRPRVSKCPQSFGSQCDFFGPMTTALTHADSFFSRGLGTTASGCPGSEFRALPEGTFPDNSAEALATQKCGRSDLLPLITRDRPSYGPEPSIRELQNSSNLIPGAWQATGYNGLNSLGNLIGREGENLFIQNSRELARQTWIAEKQMEAGARSSAGGPIKQMGRYENVQRYGVAGAAPLYA
jgi:hypothetical protein